MNSITQILLDLKSSIPPELDLESFSGRPIDLREDRLLRMFQLQAFTLQLLYDNVQLLLHRPLLAYGGLNIPPLAGKTSESSGDNPSKHDQGPKSSLTDNGAAICRSSRNQCWESALRTSRLGKYHNILLAARNTSASPYVGIQTFTAGVILSLFALSTPFTVSAQEAKQAIGRLIQMPKVLNCRTPLSDQTANLMEELVGLILTEERKSLIPGVGANKEFDPKNWSSRLCPESASRTIPPPHTTNSMGSAWPNGQYGESSNTPGTYGRGTMSMNSGQQPPLVTVAFSAGIEGESDSAAYGPFSHSTALTEDYNHGVRSVQNGRIVINPT